MNEKWFKDLMIQKYQCDNYFDPTKLFIVMSLTENGVLKEKYSIKEIATYVYRYYISNIEIAKRNFNIIVRNIDKYGIDDIIPIVNLGLSQWIKEQKNDSIYYYETFIKLNLKSYDDKTLELTRRMVKTLFLKYYKIKLNNIYDYSSIKNIDDKELDEFGNSLAKTLIIEDFQFCPITEETNIDNLYAVRIFSKEDGASEEDLISKDNLMLFSKDIAVDFINKKFTIDSFGRIHNISSKNVNEKMRISINLLNDNRKKYINLRNKKIEVV